MFGMKNDSFYYNARMLPISIVLQAGGASRRMGGQDKALLPFADTTLAGYLIEQALGQSEDIFVISNNPGFPRLGLPVYRDIQPGLGALGGLETALHYAQSEIVMLLACDMPFVHWPVQEMLLGWMQHADVVLPRWKQDEFGEPFRAVYRKGCLGPVQQALAAGERRMISFYDSVRVRIVEPEEIRPLDPQGFNFINSNTPEELAAAEALYPAFEVERARWNSR